MTGIFEHIIDAKGRLAIPARLKEELGEVFYVALPMEDKTYLAAYTAETWQGILDKVNAMPFSMQGDLRGFFGLAARCELDAQGRILIPQNLRDIAKLDKNVTIVGNNNRAEIWSSELYALEKSKDTPEKLAALLKGLGF